MYCVQKIDIQSKLLEFEDGDPSATHSFGLGPLLILLLIFQKLEKRELTLDQILNITEIVKKEAKSLNSIGYNNQNPPSLYQALLNLIITSSPDTALLLANTIFECSKIKMSEHFKDILDSLNLDHTVAKNMTGRKHSKIPQRFSINDLKEISLLFTEIPPELKYYLKFSDTYYNNKFINNSSFLLKNNKVEYGYFFGENSSECFCIRKINEKYKLIIVSGANNAFHRDYLVEKAIYEIKYTEHLKPSIDKKFEKNEIVLNFIGDTYFGEFYSERRLLRKTYDTLTMDGYDHSLNRLRTFLTQADFNIVNLEAALVDKRTPSPLKGLKKFILGARPSQTLNALKKANIHAVTLANNHTADFGNLGIKNTIDELKAQHILHCGAGMDSTEANKPMRFEINGKYVTIFSAYWYRFNNHRVFKFYATPSKSGVNTIEGELLESIRLERKTFPDSYIIVLPHWGVDFLPVQNYQRNLANQIVDAGADLILGHGPHTIQQIYKTKDKPIIFSMGNGFFNSDGEYDGYPDAAPYGFISQLLFSKNKLMKLRLYPIYSNNCDTRWQPNFVNSNDFKKVLDYLLKVNSDLSNWNIVENVENPYLELMIS